MSPVEKIALAERLSAMYVQVFAANPRASDYEVSEMLSKAREIIKSISMDDLRDQAGSE